MPNELVQSLVGCKHHHVLYRNNWPYRQVFRPCRQRVQVSQKSGNNGYLRYLIDQLYSTNAAITW